MCCRYRSRFATQDKEGTRWSEYRPPLFETCSAVPLRGLWSTTFLRIS
jgi:hypothetical protein